ncbi:MAG TPA: galactokinase [Anaerolineaceae bacterium]|nr:galactokinase [Anaerolineaceae bacterium]
MVKPVYCYIILCEDQSFYTGWTKNIESRYKKHELGKGSKYTKLHKPIKVIYWETLPKVSSALKREFRIKRFKRPQKEKLLNGWDKLMKLPSEFQGYEYLSIAPGRVNLIGEHIDYNGGPVLPAAINRYVYLGANKTNDDIIRIKSLDFNQSVTFSICDIQSKLDVEGNPLPEWALYPAGVIWAAQQRKLGIQSFDGIYSSTVPIGAGLSSSAAVEVSFAALLRELCHWDIDNLELAKICQEAENSYVGVNCGLMDQFASANGVQSSALYFNTLNLDWFPVKLPEDFSLVITNSKLPRTLSNSEYNERRKSCEISVKIIQKKYPEKHYLSQVTLEEFEEFREELGEENSKRVEHVIRECARVEQSIVNLENNNVEFFGKLLIESHVSLRDLYEVSTPELDLLVEIAIEQEGCIGSKLTGAGFGGCIVSLVKQNYVTDFVKRLEEKYNRKMNKSVESYICEASDGVSVRWHDLSG